MLNLQRTKILDGVYINTVFEKKFKTNNISISLIIPLDGEIAPSASLLSELLTHSCKKYPDFTDFNKRLKDLYDVYVNSSCEKIGDNLVLTFSTMSINNKYALNNENITAEVIDLLKEMLLNPKVSDGAFSQKEFEIEKSQLLDNIDAEYNEKRSYSIEKAISYMFENNVYSTKSYGSREQVENITSKQVFSDWQKILKLARIEIFTVGELDSTSIEENFKNMFKDIDRCPCEISNTTITLSEPKKISEEAQLSQSKLVMCYSCDTSKQKFNPLVYRMLAAVLGGTTSSKFFLNIREKQSLCYYCQAKYVESKNFFIFDSGVETKNLEKTENEIKNELKKLANGDLTEDELYQAKLYIANIYKTFDDIPSSIESWYIGRIITNSIYSAKEASDYIMNITADEIINAAKTLVLNTTFELKGKTDNE